LEELRWKAGLGLDYLQRDIWRVHLRELPKFQALMIRHLRVMILTFRGLIEDRCQLRASALTFYSLLSIVPVLAMIFGIAKGFGFEKTLRTMILERLEGQEQVALQVIDFSHALLENVKGGLVAGVGILLLFYTIVKILSHIENAFNDIWGVKTPRTLGRKITDYLSMMLICPFLFLLSSAATVIIASGVKLVMEKIALLGALSPVVMLFLNFLPFCVLWVLFAFVYMFMPNTRVRLTSAVLAAVIAGTAYHVFQWGYIQFQLNVSRYNAIYGSFAALPLFFIWLQISWLIVLFGAEISFAHQNEDTYEFEEDCLNASRAFKRLLSLRITHLLVRNFSEGAPAWTARRISEHLGTPIRLVNLLVHELVECGIFSQAVSADDREPGYQPGKDPDSLTLQYVIDALDEQGTNEVPVARTPELERIEESLKTFSRLLEASPANKLLKEL
ncbi:MAG: YihY/virulence factor BrkB family protein, partial [Desulfobacteraceae bacterium]